MSKKLRTPIIMPRKQGGTFYTFGSAMEDIGLNINESHNRVELSHYVLLDIPNFANDLDTDKTFLNLTSEMDYSSSEYTVDSSTQGDFIFADQFQNYCLNFETVLRNQDNYNYASNKTVSERVFWKWLFGRMKNDNDRFVTDGDYIYEKKEKAIAKAFGAISAGSQRTDDSGLYNETFVQIPSSYGQMRVLFKKVIDENYIETSYEGTNENRWIENIDASEITQIESDNVVNFYMDSGDFSYPSYGTIITETSTGRQFKVIETEKSENQITAKWIGDPAELPGAGNLEINGENQPYRRFGYNSNDVIKSTGISPISKSDSEYSSYATYTISENRDYDKFEVEFDINKLRTYYNNNSLTYDDIGMSSTSNIDIDNEYDDFRFNAILVYYSIYDANKTKRLSTNAYGIYILDGAIESSEITGMFYFPSILKVKSGANKNGSSYSFRINVKPSTAYSGDITVNDNSTAGYSMSEDFNDVLRNLTAAVTTMKENAKTLYSMAKDSKDIKQLVSTTMEKIDGIESDISNIKNGNFPYAASEIYKKEGTYSYSLTPSTARMVLNCIQVSYDYNTGKVNMKIDTSGLSGIPLRIANSLKTSINENNYLDIISIVALLVSRISGITQTTSKKLETIASSYDQVSPLTSQTT
jgi:hypothetical protein